MTPKDEPTSAPAMTPQQAKLSDTNRSGLKSYKEFAVGNDASFAHFLSYELMTLLFSPLPGLIGFGLRALFYPKILKKCGKRPAVGRSVVIRIPRQISLGSGVLLDDFSVLDVRGDDAGIELGERVSIGRFSTIAAKHGTIKIGNGVNVGSYCRIATNSSVDIGESVLIGAFSYIGPGNHTRTDKDAPLIEQPMDIKGGVKIGEQAWIGAGVTILDGVSIGKGAIIGAHALVMNDVPDYGVAVGAPAKTIKINQ